MVLQCRCCSKDFKHSYLLHLYTTVSHNYKISMFFALSPLENFVKDKPQYKFKAQTHQILMKHLASAEYTIIMKSKEIFSSHHKCKPETLSTIEE